MAADQAESGSTVFGRLFRRPRARRRSCSCTPVFAALPLALLPLLAAPAAVPPSVSDPSAAGAPLMLSEEERAYVISHPVARVVVDDAFAPMEFLGPSGKPCGISIDVLGRIGALSGLRFETSARPTWTEALAALERGEADMASCMAETPDRLRYLEFTRPYIAIANLIYGGIHAPYVDDLRVLKGYRVLAVKDYAVSIEMARDYPEIDLVPVEDTEAGVRDLSRGRADYLIADIASAGYLIQRDGVSTIKVAGETPYSFELRMAARKDRAPLASILAKAMAAIPNEELRGIRLSWFSSPVPHRADWRPFAIAGLLAFLAAAVAFAWIRTLSARVQARTADLASAKLELERALAAKELVLKELNHRIKNNLLMVLSLVRLSGAESGEKENRALEETAGRIEAIARVHEQLVERDDNLASLDLGAYLAELAAGLRSTAFAGTSVALATELAPGIELGLKQVVSLGMIANELVANARKYAFPGGGPGTVRLGLSRRPEGAIVLEIADDGVGMDGDSPARPGSLGATLVRALAEGIGASLEVESAKGSGTAWRIALPA